MNIVQNKNTIFLLRLFGLSFICLLILALSACFNPEIYDESHVPSGSALNTELMKDSDGALTMLRISWYDSAFDMSTTTHLRIFRRDLISMTLKDSILKVKNSGETLYIEDEGLTIGRSYRYVLYGKNDGGYSIDSTVFEHHHFFPAPDLKIRQLRADLLRVSSDEFSPDAKHWEFIDSIRISNESGSAVMVGPGDSTADLDGFIPGIPDSIFLHYPQLSDDITLRHAYPVMTIFPAVKDLNAVAFNDELYRLSWKYPQSFPDTVGLQYFTVNDTILVELYSRQKIQDEEYYVSYVKYTAAAGNPYVFAEGYGNRSKAEFADNIPTAVETGYIYIDNGSDGFYIAESELSNDEFLAHYSDKLTTDDAQWLSGEDFIITDGNYSVKAGRGAMPLRGISYQKASDLFTDLIPTKEQWEAAARGGSRDMSRAWPWGNELPDAAHCVYAGAEPVEVTSNNDFRSGSVFLTLSENIRGPVHMAGNVSEWVRGDGPIAKGGSYNSYSDRDLRIDENHYLDSNVSYYEVGIRLLLKK